MKTLFQTVFALLLLAVGSGGVWAQGSLPLLIDLSPVEGRELTPQSALDYRIVHSGPTPIEVRIMGTIRHRDQKMYLKYEFTRRLQPGMNLIADSRSGISWQSDNGGLRSLFVEYNRLPQGTYEYCVEVLPGSSTAERPKIEGNVECVYYTADDLFALNLIDPEDKAVLREPYPVFSWVANCPFVAELTYRIRVAEQHAGQNAVNAIARNNPMWQEGNLFAPTAVYPVNGRPLEYGVPYVWTVDAYYRGLLIGGAEVWRFMLLEDSLIEVLPVESSFIDVNVDEGTNRYYAVGLLKLKYTESEFLKNKLKIKIWRGEKEIGKKVIEWDVNHGDNFKTYDLTKLGLKHRESISISIEFSNGRSPHPRQNILFNYVEPELVQ